MEDLAEVQVFFDNADLAGAGTKVTEIHDLLPCAKQVVDTELLATYARWEALVAFFAQDEATSTKWGILSRETWEDYPWPEDMGEDHPFREMLVSSEDPDPTQPPGMELDIPRGGGVFLNGSLIVAPRALGEIPGFVQVFDKNEQCTDAFWIEGSAFPEWLLVSEDSVGYPKLPVWYVGDDPPGWDPDTARDEKERFPVVPVAIGSGLAVVSGVFYVLAATTGSGMADAQDVAELERIRSTTNGFVTASLLTGTAAASVTVGGVLTSSRTVGFTVRF